MPTRCNRGFYFRSYCLLNMFRATLCPSSGAQEYYTVDAACGIWCRGFQVVGLVWSWGLCVRFAGCCSILFPHINDDARSKSYQNYIFCLCVSVPLVIQHAKRMPRILLSLAASLAVPRITTSHKQHEFLKEVFERKVCVWFCLKFLPKLISNSGENSAKYYYKCTLVFI